MSPQPALPPGPCSPRPAHVAHRPGSLTPGQTTNLSGLLPVSGAQAAPGGICPLPGSGSAFIRGAVPPRPV